MTEDLSFVIAVDPGGTTGIAWHIASVPLVDGTEVGGGNAGFVKWWHEMFDANQTNAYIRPQQPTLVICEDFIVNATTHKKTRQTDAQHIIGGLAFWCQIYEVPLVLPKAADKNFGTDDKLKALGWYDPGHGHKNDALRHLLKQLVIRNYPPMIQRMIDVAHLL